MKLKDFIYSLILGELSDTAIGNEFGLAKNIITGKDEVNELSPRSLYTLIDATNDALQNIYSSFRLKIKNIIIEEQENITLYYLEKKFAETTQAKLPPGIHPYIKDSPHEPFADDIIKILNIYDANGNIYPLNDKYRINSIFIPLPNAVSDLHPATGKILNIEYQANHYLLDNVNINNINNTNKDEQKDLLEQELEAPLYINNAMHYYVAYEYFMHTNSPRDAQQAQMYYQLYQGELKSLQKYDFNQSFQTNTHHKFQLGNWV